VNFAKKEIALPSDQLFGLFISVIFLILAIRGYFFSTWPFPLLYFLVASAVGLTTTALVAPITLRPLNWLWYRLGLFIGQIVSPIALGVIFFGVLTPCAVCTRILGRDVLRLKRSRSLESHWITRDSLRIEPRSFKNQF